MIGDGSIDVEIFIAIQMRDANEEAVWY